MVYFYIKLYYSSLFLKHVAMVFCFEKMIWSQRLPVLAPQIKRMIWEIGATM